MKKLCHYISEYMGVLVLAAALLAVAFPSVLQQVPTTVINYLLGVVMFGMGLTLNLMDFKIVFSRPKDVIIGCLAQFTVMPLLAWALARRGSGAWCGAGRLLSWRHSLECDYLSGKRRLGIVRGNDRRFHLAGSAADALTDMGIGRKEYPC